MSTEAKINSNPLSAMTDEEVHLSKSLSSLFKLMPQSIYVLSGDVIRQVSLTEAVLRCVYGESTSDTFYMTSKFYKTEEELESDYNDLKKSETELIVWNLSNGKVSKVNSKTSLYSAQHNFVPYNENSFVRTDQLELIKQIDLNTIVAEQVDETSANELINFMGNITNGFSNSYLVVQDTDNGFSFHDLFVETKSSLVNRLKIFTESNKRILLMDQQDRLLDEPVSYSYFFDTLDLSKNITLKYGVKAHVDSDGFIYNNYTSGSAEAVYNKLKTDFDPTKVVILSAITNEYSTKQVSLTEQAVISYVDLVKEINDRVKTAIGL